MRVLSKEELLACARGFCQTQEQQGALLFGRFGEAALRYYAQRDGWAVRARCPTGVMLDFLTDADAVHVRAELTQGARLCGFFDLYADGLFTGTLGSANAAGPLAGVLPCGLEGDRKRRRVQLWLPHARPVALQEVSLPAGATFEPAPRGKVMLFLGDSITQGMDALHPSFGYAMTAARLLGLEHYNYGIGGAVFAAESLPEAPVASPLGIVVAYGTNDWSGALSTELARAYLKRVRSLWPQTPVTVLEPLWRTIADGQEGKPNESGQTLAAYRAELAGIVAGIGGMRYVRHAELLPPGPALLADGTHPGDAGHLVYGANLARLMG